MVNKHTVVGQSLIAKRAEHAAAKKAKSKAMPKWLRTLKIARPRTPKSHKPLAGQMTLFD